jgi:hypothetical protein
VSSQTSPLHQNPGQKQNKITAQRKLSVSGVRVGATLTENVNSGCQTEGQH